MLVPALILFWSLSALLLWSMCKAASKADRDIERMNGGKKL